MAIFKKISELPESEEKGYTIITVNGVSKKFDLNKFGDKSQYVTMPNASEYAGKIVQYVGETTVNYTKGMFYASIQNGQGEYEWTSVKLDEIFIPDTIARKSYVDDIDSNLQQQIDAITSSTDVRDVVGTYAELLAYDTSILFNNDVVKVLVDENKNNAISYYRWVITEGVGAWFYVGSQGPFYTKAESDSKYATKNELQTGLSTKADDTNVLHKTGAETASGVKTFSDGIKIASVGVQYDTTNECLKFVFN